MKTGERAHLRVHRTSLSRPLGGKGSRSPLAKRGAAGPRAWVPVSGHWRWSAFDPKRSFPQAYQAAAKQPFNVVYERQAQARKACSKTPARWVGLTSLLALHANDVVELIRSPVDCAPTVRARTNEPHFPISVLRRNSLDFWAIFDEERLAMRIDYGSAVLPDCRPSSDLPQAVVLQLQRLAVSRQFKPLVNVVSSTAELVIRAFSPIALQELPVKFLRL